MTTKTHVSASAVATNASAGEILEITITEELADTPAINFKGARGMLVRCPAGDVESLSIALNHKETGTYTGFLDEDGTDVEIALDGAKWTPVAKEIFAAFFVKIYGADAAIEVMAKG